MWSLETIWFDIALYSLFLLLGNILMGHFEERTSRYRRLAKTFLTLLVFTGVSGLFGRTVGFTLLGVSILPVLYIHLIALPKRGIHGWTGEPKDKYYEYRGWDKDIFKSGTKKD